MLAELQGKGGQVCQAAKQGQLRCPLIVRPTSEDVITSNVFQLLRAINPRWWLPQLLNKALGTHRFRQQIFRKLKIELWRNAAKFPPQLLPWREGSTQVDVTITWENPPTTIFMEAKYLSDLANSTSGNDGSHGFPADQLIRNIRIGLWETGWWHENRLLHVPPRQFAMLLFTPQVGHPLVAQYRNLHHLKQALPGGEKLSQFPNQSFIGEIDYEGLVKILLSHARWVTQCERTLIEDLTRYLRFKRLAAHNHLSGNPLVQQTTTVIR